MKIALMGSAPSSRMLGPFNDQEWEIWSCSPPNYDLPRVDAWFELHSLDRKLGIPANQPYIETILRHPRVYIVQKDVRFPNAIEFPWRDLVREFGSDFFSSSLSWMMAQAITMKPDKIGLWGIDLSATEEYERQRPGLKFFIREARQRGIQVYAPPQSDIMTPSPLYGVKEHTHFWGKEKARREELEARYTKAAEQKKNAEREMLIFQGALDDMQYISNTYDGVEWGNDG